MQKEKKYKGVFEDRKIDSNGNVKITYHVSTTLTTKDKQKYPICKRGFEHARDANAWKTIKAQEVSEMYLWQLKGDKKGILQLAEQFLDYKKSYSKYNTLKRFDYLLTQYLPKYFDKIPDDITTKDIETFYIDLSNSKMKKSSKNVVIRTLKKFFEYLDTMELAKPDLIRRYNRIVITFKEDEAKNDFIELDDYKKLMNTFDKYKDNHYYVLFELLYYSGCRLGEALGLKYSDIDFDKCTMSIVRQAGEYTSREEKNNSLLKSSDSEGFEIIGRTIILPYTKTDVKRQERLPNAIIEDILERKQMNNSEDDEYIFKKGNVIIGRVSTRNILRYHLDMVGLKHIKPHDFRHSHITMLYEMGCDGKYVAERVGHANESTSKNIYEHITAKRKEKNDSIIDNLIV